MVLVLFIYWYEADLRRIRARVQINLQSKQKYRSYSLSNHKKIKNINKFYSNKSDLEW